MTKKSIKTDVKRLQDQEADRLLEDPRVRACVREIILRELKKVLEANPDILFGPVKPQ